VPSTGSAAQPRPTDGRRTGNPASMTSELAAVVLIATILYFAREILVPLTLAVLLSFALGPLVMVLRRWYLGRVPSVIVAVLFAIFVIAGVGSLIGGQVARLAENLPKYQYNIAEKIHSLPSTADTSGILGRASQMLQYLGNQMTDLTSRTDAPNAPPGPGHTASQRPVPVEIYQPGSNALRIIEAVIGPLVQPLVSAGMVIVFVFFLLLQREDIRDRFIRLAGTHDIQRTTRGLDDAAERLSRYLLVQTVINTCFGVVIGVGLSLIGVPNSLLWGALALLLRFVPYIGSAIAAIFPALLALAVDPGWSMVAWTAALFLVAEPITGQIIEPWFYGHSTGLSAVAVVVAAAFWTWLWGPIGLLLSTPLTLCLVVLGRHVKQLEFFDIILGDQPALTLEENFYQRILADDPDEAARQAEEFLKEKPLDAYYDEVALPGLELAQMDVGRGALEREHQHKIKEAVDELIDDLSDHIPGTRFADSEERTASTEDAAQSREHRAPPRKLVMCVGGRGPLDDAAATMLARLLNLRELPTEVVTSAAVSAANIVSLDAADIKLAFLSYLEPGGFTHARYLVRRLRRKLPSARIFVGFWTLSEEEAKNRNALQETGADGIVTSLRRAADAAADSLPSG